jgi:hypothetical protein
MMQFRRWLFLGLILLGTQLSAGCYLGYTNRPVLFPNVALTPAVARPGSPCGCGPTCYREFGPSGCGGSLFAGSGAGAAPVVTGPVYDAPVSVLPPYGGPAYGGGYPAPAPTPGCVGCAANHGGFSGIPIAGSVGGPPIAVSPAGGPIYGVPYDSGAVPTLKPPGGSIPLQMPNEVKESKKIVATGK